MSFLDDVKSDSMSACDCHDCDGKWCIWCLEHHGRKSCPVVEDVKREGNETDER